MNVRMKRNMKTLISWMLMCTLLLTGFCIPQVVQAGANTHAVFLELSPETIHPGDTVAANVYAQPNTDYELSIYDYGIDDYYKTPSGKEIIAEGSTNHDGKTEIEIDIPKDMPYGTYDLSLYNINLDEEEYVTDITILEKPNILTLSAKTIYPGDTITAIINAQPDTNYELSIYDYGIDDYYKTPSGKEIIAEGSTNHDGKTEVEIDIPKDMPHGTYDLSLYNINLDEEEYVTDITILEKPETLKLSAKTIYPGDRVTASVYAQPNTDYELSIYDYENDAYYKTPSGEEIVSEGSTDHAGKAELEISIPKDIPPGEYDLVLYNLNTEKDEHVIKVIISPKLDHMVSREIISAALDKATGHLSERFDDTSFNYQQHWMAIALHGFDKAVPGSYLENIKNGDMPARSAGQYGKYILGILAAGGDPTAINGRNLLEELCQLDDMVNVETQGGIYTTPFGLLALDAVDYDIPADAGFTRDEIVNKLIAMADPNGGEDGVGFVLTALGKYYDEKSEVKTAVDKVAASWANRQGPDGGFGAGGWSPKNNVNSAAQVLMGLSFNGKNPQSEQFTKAEGNLISFILSLQNEDGTFNWQQDNPGAVSIATEQASYALAQYLRQLDGRKNIYDFTGDPPPSDLKAPIITTDLSDKTVNTSTFTFTASAHDEKDGMVIPVVMLEDKTVTGTNGTYTVTLTEGEHIITITATDVSANKAEKSFTITYAAIDMEVPSEDRPNIKIPADDNDYKIPIEAQDGHKAITIEIPHLKHAKVVVALPFNSTLPKIEAVKGDVSAVIPKGTQVVTGEASFLELISSKDTEDTALRNMLHEIVPKGKELDEIVRAFSMGGSKTVAFSEFVNLTLTGMKGKEAAYVQNGSIHHIAKYLSALEGLDSGKQEYAYESGNDLIIRTKHFTDFIGYSTRDIPEDVPDPQPKEYVTLSVDKFTIDEGYVISPAKIELEKGDTAWTVLKRELDKRDIDYRYIWSQEYDSVYLQSIDGDGEFDHGGGSGWMYAVNGWYPNYGASQYTLKNADKLKWRYTTNLGKDLGEDLSRWDTPAEQEPKREEIVIDSKNKTPSIDIPEDGKNDYILNIKKALQHTDNITINIPDIESKVIVNLEEVKGNIPKIIGNKGHISVVIEKGTKLKTKDSKIELITTGDINAEKIQELIQGKIGKKNQYVEVENAFVMGSTGDEVLFDRPVTLILRNTKGQYVGFIEENKFTPIEIFETEENGVQATKGNRKKTYAFVKDNDLYIKTNYFTTFASYTVNMDLEKLYVDMDEISPWAYRAVREATQKGFIGGDNGEFKGKANITRAEFVKIMVSVLGLDTEAHKGVVFTDVNEHDWFYPYMHTAYSAGLIKGYRDKINPKANITREQMAVIINRALDIQHKKSMTAIRDIDVVSAWAKKDVEAISAQGLMVGHDHQFNPMGLVTREMAVVVAMRAYDYQKGLNREVKHYIDETGVFMQEVITDPVVASVGGEWTVLSLARSHIKVPESYYAKYYANAEKKLKQTSGKLHHVKYTEYDRVILAVSAIGQDVTNVAGYDLTKPLADFNVLIKQGLNGPIWALIALDSNKYPIPIDKNAEVQTTREMLVDYILSREINGGGWSLTSEAPADTDITAMVLQALSNYQDNEKVKQAIDRALTYLSSTQQEDGSFKSNWGNEANCESIAQVIVALTSLDIDPRTDKRFIKNGKDTITALLAFYVEGGGFRHTLGGEVNPMATDQGMYALVAYDRFKNGQKHLYDMTDVTN